VLSSLAAEDRSLVEMLKRTTILAPITLADVPDSLARVFREKDGNVGRIVLVYPTLQATAEHGKVQMEYARSIRTAARGADPEAQVAGGIILMADVIAAITHDGSIATVVSFAGVVLLAVLLTRSLRDVAWIVGALCVGTLWMGGVFGALGLKMNFANFVVLPITFGIGVDYAVNLYQRYKEVGSGGTATALAGSGGAVLLCSLTTIIGYGTLLVADYQAVFSFGLSAVIGEITCLASALLAMPAFLAVRDAHIKSRYFFETTAPPPSR
jgi:predicted RND superfamily exporter protein